MSMKRYAQLKSRILSSLFSGPLWSAVRLTLRSLMRWHATSRLRAVVATKPADANEALDKTLFLMAILLSDSEQVDRQLIRRASRSLAPFRAEVLSALMNQDPRRQLH